MDEVIDLHGEPIGNRKVNADIHYATKKEIRGYLQIEIQYSKPKPLAFFIRCPVHTCNLCIQPLIIKDLFEDYYNESVRMMENVNK